MKMLVYSEPQLISLLPSMPKEWSRGSIKGVALRGGIVMENMTWSEQGVEVTFLSQTDQKVGVALRGEKVTEISLRAGKSSKFTF